MPKRKGKTRAQRGKTSREKGDNPVAKRRAIEAKFRRMQERRARKMRVEAERKSKIQILREERESEMLSLQEKEEQERHNNLSKRQQKQELIEKRQAEEERRRREREKALQRGEDLPLEEAPLPDPLSPADPNIIAAPKPIKPRSASEVKVKVSQDAGDLEAEVLEEEKEKKEEREEKEAQSFIETEEAQDDPLSPEKVPAKEEQKTGVRRINTGGSRTSRKKPSKKRQKVKNKAVQRKSIKTDVASWKRDLRSWYNDYQDKKITREAKQNKEALRRARERIDPNFTKSGEKQKKESALSLIGKRIENPLSQSISSLRSKRLERGLRDVVGLDIGASAIRAVLFSSDGETILAERALPEGVILSGSLQEEDELRRQLKTLWKEAEIPSNKVNFSLSSELLMVRTVFLPSGKQEDIESALTLNADAIIAPMQAEDSVIDYKNLLRSGPEMAVQVIASDKIIAQSYLEAVKSAGLTPVAAQPGTLAASQTLVIPRSPHSSHALIDIGAETTKVLACSGPDVFYLRVIPIAGNHFTRAIMNRLGVSWKEAEDIKLHSSLKESPSDDLGKKVLAAQRPIADRLAQEILQSKEAYALSEIGKKRPMENCLFIGGGSLLLGLKSQIQFFAGFQSVLESRPTTAIEDAETVTYFSSGIGLAMKQEGSLLPSERKSLLRPALQPRISSAKKQKRLVSRENRRVSPTILALLLSVLLVTGAIFWNNNIKSSNEQLSADIALAEKVAPARDSTWGGVLSLEEGERAQLLRAKTVDEQQSLTFLWRGSLDAFRAALSREGVSVREISILRAGKSKIVEVVISNG